MRHSELYNLVVPSAEEASVIADGIIFAFCLALNIFAIFVVLFFAVGLLVLLWDFVKTIPERFRNLRFRFKKNRP